MDTELHSSAVHTTVYVIIPVFNCIHYLQNAVESVISQGTEGLSIVLVDDGSTDGSAALCDHLAEQNSNILVIHKENGGVASARNCALIYLFNMDVNGYVTFLDADDLWLPNFYDESVCEKLRQGYSLVWYQSCVCNAACRKREMLVSMSEGEHIGGEPSVFLHSAQHFGAMFYSIELLKRYDLEFALVRYCEDRAFAMQCMYLADKVWLENKLFYAYRQHGASVVHNRNYGIPYFDPIIDNWLKSDAKMEPFANEKRGILSQGHVLARLYIMDMIDEHYRMFGKRKEVYEFMKSRPEYIELLKSDIGPQKLTDRFNRMMRNSVKYRIKNRIIGVIFLVARHISRWPIVRWLKDYRRYRITV